MTQIHVPGTQPGPQVAKGALLGSGAFALLMMGILVWLAATSGRPSLWVIVLALGVMAAGFISSIALNLSGRAGVIRLSRPDGRWAAVSSLHGQQLILIGAVTGLVLTLGVLLLAGPDAPMYTWIIGSLAGLGVFTTVRRLRTPVGWYFEPQILGAVTVAKGTEAFTWDEVEHVELNQRGVSVAGRGRVAEIVGGDTASDPAVLARVIEFYRTNPFARAELADDRFLNRLRSGQL